MNRKTRVVDLKRDAVQTDDSAMNARRQVDELMNQLDDETLADIDALIAPPAPGDRHPQSRSAYWASQIPEVHKRKRRGVVWSLITGPATAFAGVLAFVNLADGRYVLGAIAVAVAVILGVTFFVQFAEARRDHFLRSSS